MEDCMIYHTGYMERGPGRVIGNVVYALGKEGELVSPRDAYWRTGFEFGYWLTQIELNGKWGFADNCTGEIVIPPAYEYAGAFSGGYAHVAVGCRLEETQCGSTAGTMPVSMQVKGGKHGFIDLKGHLVVPCKYDAACDISREGRFVVMRGEHYGVVDVQGNTIVEFEWNYTLGDYIFFGWDGFVGAKWVQPGGEQRELRWGLLHQNGKVLVDNLAERPWRYRYPHGDRRHSRHLLLRRGSMFGVAYGGGSLICAPTMRKREAVALIHTLDEENYEKRYQELLAMAGKDGLLFGRPVTRWWKDGGT